MTVFVQYVIWFCISFVQLIVISCALVAVAVAAPVEPEPVQILHSELKQEPDGSYTYV